MKNLPLKSTPQALTDSVRVSSLEISALTGKSHHKVTRDIRTSLSQRYGKGMELLFKRTYRHPKNRCMYVEYILPTSDVMRATKTYGIDQRARIIQHLEKLETLANKTITDRQYGYRKSRLRRKLETTNSKAHELTILLDESQDWATLDRVETATNREFDAEILAVLSKKLGRPPRQSLVENFSRTPSYHSDVWYAAYGIQIEEL